MEDFAELLAFVELELFTIDQAVWIACDQVPPADTRKRRKRPTDRHMIAEQRIRAEVPSIKDALPGIQPAVIVFNNEPIEPSKQDAWSRVDLIAWFRSTPAFGQLFLAAVDSTAVESTAFKFSGKKKDQDQDRVTAWRALCDEMPAARTRAWTDRKRFDMLKLRYPTLFNCTFDHFKHHIWPKLTAAMPILD